MKKYTKFFCFIKFNKIYVSQNFDIFISIVMSDADVF